MSMPGFTAEASLHTLDAPYRGTGGRLHGEPQTGVVPQAWVCRMVCDPNGGNCDWICGLGVSRVPLS